MKRLFSFVFVFLVVLSTISCSFAAGSNVDSSTAVDIVEEEEESPTASKGSGSNSSGTNGDSDSETLESKGGSNVATPDSSSSYYLGDDWEDPADLLGISESLTIEEIGDKLEAKGGQVAKLFQKIGRQICIICFVLCCIVIIISVLGNPKMAMQGAIGCVLAGAMYMCITYGAEIVRIIANFFVV
jgi:tetrahydromethanopterin S-methyltransferase subunit G